MKDSVGYFTFSGTRKEGLTKLYDKLLYHICRNTKESISITLTVFKDISILLKFISNEIYTSKMC